MTTKLPPLALVTGASRGLGAAYAKNLAQRGYRLLLVARDESKLSELAGTLCSRHGSRVYWQGLDLSHPEAGTHLYHFARPFCDAPDLLINNAGFGMYGTFHEHPVSEVRRMLQLHITTIVDTIHFFLPAMIARRSGAIINISSLAAFFSLPYMAEYAATKAFLLSFSEALAEEVHPFGIQIQACCPGQTATEFHSSAGFRPRGIGPPQDPDQVVRASLTALGSRYSTVTIGWQGYLARMLAQWLPQRFLSRKAALRTRPPHSKNNSGLPFDRKGNDYEP